MPKRPTGTSTNPVLPRLMSLSNMHQDYHVLNAVATDLLASAAGYQKLKTVLGQVLRDVIDSIIKTAKTGRRFYSDLQNSEKTYVGTAVEIELRAALGLPRGTLLDLNVNGREVDVKFSGSRSWMIPPEAVDHPCVLISANDVTARVSLGVIVARMEYLGALNRDQKRGILAAGRKSVMWLFEDEPYPSNFWQSVTPRTADLIADGKSGNERVSTLFREVTDRAVPRKVVEDVATQKDFMRRVRADSGRGTRNVLASQGILLLSGARSKDRQMISTLGLSPLKRDQFMSHRLTAVERVAARAAGYEV